MLRFDIRWGMVIALMVLVMVTDASAQRLFETDGVELSGSVRVVARGVGTCNLVEASHTEAVYERIKVNHGQPLNVWRVDFSAYNGSGKPLSSLSAHFKIKSEWPPCTNWSGPSGSYSKPVLWGGSCQVLQKPYGMEAGEEVRDTIFLLVFHEHRPEFESWDVDFRFGELMKAAPGQPSAARRSAAEPAVADSVRRVAPGTDVPGMDKVRPKTRQRLPFEPEMVVIPGGKFSHGLRVRQRLVGRRETGARGEGGIV